MTKLEELVGMKALVYDIMLNNENTRDDDRILYLKVLAYDCERKGKDVSKISLREWLTYNASFPSYDTVTRARRKVQELYPEVRGIRTQEHRTSLIRHYRAFAREEK